MSKYDSKYTKDILSRIIGKRIQDFFFEDRTLVLYFGVISPNKCLKENWDLWIDCAWRLDDGKRIIAAYFDSAELVKPVLVKLKEATLTEIEHKDVTQDLELNLSSGIRLKVFTYSTMDKQWELRGPNGYLYGIGPNLKPYEKIEHYPYQD